MARSMKRLYMRSFCPIFAVARRRQPLEPARQLTLGSLAGRLNRCADSRITGLDRGIDEIQSLFVRHECALHGIDRNLLEVIQRQTECFCGGFEFPAHCSTAHQSIVCVECDPEFFLVENAARMLWPSRRRACMNNS